MPYDTSIPKTGSNGSADYSAMQGNYLQIQNSFSIDHESLGNSGALEGFHKKTTFAAPIGDPGQMAPVASLYTKTVSGLSQLFFQNGALAANVAQLTGNSVLTASEYTVVTPWGLTLKFGSSTASPAGIAHTFATNFATAAAGMTITVQNAGSMANAVVITGANAFTAYCASGTQTIYYVAWGT